MIWGGGTPPCHVGCSMPLGWLQGIMTSWDHSLLGREGLISAFVGSLMVANALITPLHRGKAAHGARPS